MQETKPAIAIASERGDPRDPRAWSGTPSNLIGALERQGYTVFGIDSTIKKRRYHRAYRLLHRAFGLGDDYLSGRFARMHCAKYVQAQSLGLGCTKVLHMGLLDLPLPKTDTRVEHYAFLDTNFNLLSQYTQNITRYTPRMHQLIEKLDRESYAQLKHIFTTSEYVRNNLINHYQIDSNHVTSVGTGRGTIEPFTAEKDYRNGHILFVVKSDAYNFESRFEEKGGTLLIEGFKLAQRKNPSLKLVVVGNDKYASLIGDVPNVTVKGYVSWEELQNLFYTAALFAMPTPNEAWGLVYLEALACKTPVLGLNQNSLPEITRNGQYGFLVDEETPERVADAILNAFSNPQRLKEMGTSGQKYCLETFSWDSVATKIASVMLGTPAQLVG